MPYELRDNDVFPLPEMLKGLVELSGSLEVVNLSYPYHPFLLLLLGQFLPPTAIPTLSQFVQIHHEAVHPLPLLLRESVPRLDHLLSKGIRLVAIEQTGVHEDVHP